MNSTRDAGFSSWPLALGSVSSCGLCHPVSFSVGSGRKHHQRMRLWEQVLQHQNLMDHPSASLRVALSFGLGKDLLTALPFWQGIPIVREII